MGAGYHGGFGKTYGELQKNKQARLAEINDGTFEIEDLITPEYDKI